MASKIKIAEGATTALAQPEKATDVPALIKGSGSMAADSPNQGFLPSLKLVYPIECGREIPAKFAYHLGISDGEGFDPLLKPFSLVALASRNATRRSIEQPDGSTTYERAYAAWKGQASSATRYAEMLAAAHAGDKSMLVGASYLVAVISTDGVCIAQCDAFKALASYIGKVLYQANIEAGLRADIEIIDHSPNLVDNKAGDRQYLGSKKFRQFKIEPLTDQQRADIDAAVADALDEIAGWVRR